ncbi:MAG: hypothetical protein K2K46_10615 [Lachnospiraceae bacterium]|nr:hypothetical protein [Lachnospiraceae bacterium]
MKKKFIVTILMCTLLISALSGCGNSSQETVETVTQSEETTVETVTETVATDTETTDTEAENTHETVTDNESAQEEDLSDTDEQEANEEFTEEDAMHKLALLFNARNELYLQDDPAIYNLLIGAEHMNAGYGNDNSKMNINTSDGVPIDWDDEYMADENAVNISDVRNAVILNYFYNYVNVDQKYYDIYEYVKSHTSDEILHGDHEYSWFCGVENTNNLTMGSVPMSLQYLFQNIDNITAGEVISGDECNIEVIGEKVEYEVPILINDEYIGAKLLFDVDGNLLNIATITEEGWSNDNYCLDSNGDKID